MKNWYESKTMWLQIIQKLQLITGAVTATAFPTAAPQVIAGMVIFGVLLSIAQIIVRTLPDHGKSITDKQSAMRNE